jgi:hypothetical protein
MAGAGETSAPVDNRIEGNLMKDLLEYIARALVDRPDEVQVQMSGGGERVRLELRVAQTDMGRIIGKSGKVANAIRTMLRVAAEREGKQATLDVVEPES